MPGIRLSLLLCCTLWAAVQEPAAAEPGPEIVVEGTSEISLRNLFRDPDFFDIALSPEGKYLAAIMPVEGRRHVVVLDWTDGPGLDVIGNFRLANIEESPIGLVWASEQRLLFSSFVQAGFEATPRPTGRLYAIDPDGRRYRRILGHAEGSLVGRYGGMMHRLPDKPRRILVYEYTHDRERPIAYEIDLYNPDRRRRTAASPLRRGGLAADRKGRVRFAYGIDDDFRQRLAWRPAGESEWRIFDNPFQGRITFWGFDTSGEYVFLNTPDPDRLGLVKLHLESGRFEVLLGDDTFEAWQPIRDARDEEIIGAIFATPVPEARFIEPAHPTARIWRSLQAALPDYLVEIVGFSEDQHLALVTASSDREPGVILVLETEAMRLREFAVRRPWIEPERMAPKRPVMIEASDGLTLHGYLTLPLRVDEPENLPLIVEVHGGPHGVFDVWFFEPWVQALAARGFAVLQVNYRGSGGRGQRFIEMGYREWGARMQDDLTEATRWAIEQGIAHPERICISGASYGGFAALAGVTREPDLYRCAFSFVGVYDLVEIQRRGNIPQRLGYGPAYLEAAVGTDEEDLRARSPISHVERIKAELFIAHGAEDEQAHVGQYHLLSRRLQEAGIEHESMLVRGEAHGFFDLDNKVELYTRALELFDRTIGSGWEGDTDSSGAEAAPDDAG